jgi:hypothetical protein
MDSGWWENRKYTLNSIKWSMLSSSSLSVPKWFSKMQHGVVDETDSPPRGGSMAQKQQQILLFITPPRPNKMSMPSSNGGEIKRRQRRI